MLSPPTKPRRRASSRTSPSAATAINGGSTRPASRVGDDDHASALVLALRYRRDPVDLVDGVVHDLAVRRVHGFEGLLLAAGLHVLGHRLGEPLERLPAALAIAGDVEAN